MMQTDSPTIFVQYGFIPPNPDEAQINRLARLLSVKEQAQLNVLIQPLAKLHFLFGRMLLRKMLHRHSPETPFHLSCSVHGKPYLMHAPHIGINLSHSDRLVAAAVAFGTDVGVDVEAIRSVKIPPFKSCFSDKELDFIQADPQPVNSFFQLWTRKEAVSKADGRGMGLSFKTLHSLNAIVTIGTARWTCTNLSLAAGYACAIAYSGSAMIHCEQGDLMQTGLCSAQARIVSEI
jgi:4'-phosphopantetheinyl transferase